MGLGELLQSMGVGVSGQQPLSQMSGIPSMQSQAASLPGMASPSPFSIIGNALANGSHGQAQAPQVPDAQAPAPQLAPFDTGFLQQLLGSIGQRRAY